MSSSNDELFGWSCVGLVLGLFSFGKGFKTLQRKRLIENTPTSKVRSLAMGLCEVYGEAKPYKGNLLKSPFSGADCLYCRYEVEEYRRSGKRSRWVTVKKGSQTVPFHLKDDTGAVVVDAHDADVDIPLDFTIEPGGGSVTPYLSEFCLKEDLKFTDFLGFSRRLRFSEYFVAPGDKLFILGTAGDNPYVAEGSAVEGFKDVMIQKGDKGRLFYISDKSEKECLKDQRLKMVLQIYGGGALFVGSLATILFKLNFF